MTSQSDPDTSNLIAIARPRPSPTSTAEVSTTPGATGQILIARTCWVARMADRAFLP